MIPITRINAGYGTGNTQALSAGSRAAVATASYAANGSLQAGAFGQGIEDPSSTANDPANQVAGSAAASGAVAAGRGGAFGATGATGPSNADGATAGVAGAGGTEKTKSTGCETCKNRKYQDISTDAGVSFKAPANIDPSVAASAVMSHEREHVSLAEGRAADAGGRIVASITLETSICEECGRVYVSGGKARITTLTPVGGKDAEKSGAESAAGIAGKGGSPGTDKPIGTEVQAGVDRAGASRTAGSGRMAGSGNSAGSDGSIGTGNTAAAQGRMVLDDGGVDLFRKIYKQTMASQYGVFFNARA